MKYIWKVIYAIPFGLILFGIFIMRHKEFAIEYWFELVLFIFFAMGIITMFQRIFFAHENHTFTREVAFLSIIIFI